VVNGTITPLKLTFLNLWWKPFLFCLQIAVETDSSNPLYLHMYDNPRAHSFQLPTARFSYFYLQWSELNLPMDVCKLAHAILIYFTKGYLHETRILCCTTQKSAVRHKWKGFYFTNSVVRHKILSYDTKFCRTTQNSVVRHKNSAVRRKIRVSRKQALITWLLTSFFCVHFAKIQSTLFVLFLFFHFFNLVN
jgi:hypothetical protein